MKTYEKQIFTGILSGLILVGILWAWVKFTDGGKCPVCGQET